MATRIQIRRDTGTNWSSTNPVLASGELGINLTTGQFKIGDGTTAWNSLNYFVGYLAGGNLNDLNDVTITSAANGDFLRWNGSAWINDAVNLSTDTVGDYVTSLVAGTGISLANNSGEGSTPTISIDATLNNLSDVNSPSPSDGQFLKYVSASSEWQPANIPTINIDDVGDVTITSAASGDFLKWNGSAWVNEVIDLGTDTTGNYVSDVTAGTGISVTHTPSEGSSPTIALNAGLNELNDVVVSSSEKYQTLAYDGAGWVPAYSPVVSYVRNAEATTLTVGTVVYLFGGTGDHASVKRADYSSDTTSSKTVGVVAANITASNNGPVVTRGYVQGMDLSAYSVGDVLWLGATGAFTTTKPSAPNHLVFVGVVVRATNNGIMYVATQNGYEIEELHDVSISSPASGDFLKYNGTVWVNDPINLGTDTVGNYMSDVSAGTGISITHTPGEGSSATIAIGQAVGTTDNVTFAGVTADNVRVGVTTANTVDVSSGNLIIDAVSTINIGSDSGATNTGIALQTKGSSQTSGGISLTPGFATGAGSGATGGDTSIYSGGAYASGGTAQSGSILIQAGMAYGAAINTGGNVSINAGNASGGTATNGSILIGTSTLSPITIGQSGQTTTVGGNLTISGDLTVNGTTTTLNTDTLNVEDNIVVLNSNVTGSPSLNAGIEIERGTSANVLVRWNETSDKWEITNDGTLYGNIITTNDSASTSVAGIVQLNNTNTSNSTTQAATANAVRELQIKFLMEVI